MKINWQAAKSCGINFGMASGRATLCPSRRATEIFGAETARDIVTGRDDRQTGLWGNCFNYCGRNLKAGESDWSYADIAPPTPPSLLPCSHFPSLSLTTNYLLHTAQSKLRPPQQPDMLRHMAHSCHCECVCVWVFVLCVRAEYVHFRGRVAKLQSGLRVERRAATNASKFLACCSCLCLCTASASVSGLGLSGCQIQIQIRLETRIGMRIHRFSRCSSHASQVKPERRLTETETICCHFGNGKTGINRNFICKCE